MSATTSDRGYTYPQSTDDFRPYEDIQQLAEDVDADVQGQADLTTGKPLLRLVQQSGQSIANNSPTALTFGSGSEEIDTHNWHNEVTNNSRYTPQLAGHYRINVTVVMTSATYSQVVAAVAKNGTRVDGQIPMRPDAATGAASGAFATAMLPMNGSTDYVEGFAAFTASGTSSTNAVAGFRCVLEVEYLRPL